jgi:glutamate-1-semialdehyde 2,1-aminomutase
MAHLVDRVSSSARTLPELDGRDLSIVSSAGPYLFGSDGRRYVDTALGFGGTMLGHAHPAVVAAATEAIRNGSLPAFSHPGEERAAAALAQRLAPLDRTIFTSSGSEAVHLAARIARTVTGRRRVAKMAAGFDGWLDDIAFGNVATPEAGFHDQHRPTNDRTTLLRFNDAADVERLFAENDDIAAVLYEPILANAACIMPAEGYLEHVQAVARRHGALLIADEVLMGFRLRPGLSSHHFGLDPDIATIGKAMGSGIPVSAVVGRRSVMDAYQEAGGLRGGTFSGNPLACAAVEATLPQLDAMDYPALRERGDALRSFLERSFAAQGIPVKTTGYGNVFGLWFGPEAPGDYEAAHRLADPDKSRSLHLALRRHGVLAMPSPYGRIYTSFAHDGEAFALLHEAFAQAAAALGTGRDGASPPTGARR